MWRDSARSGVWRRSSIWYDMEAIVGGGEKPSIEEHSRRTMLGCLMTLDQAATRWVALRGGLINEGWLREKTHMDK